MRKVYHGDDTQPSGLVSNMEDDSAEVKDLARLFNDPCLIVHDNHDALMIQRVMCLITQAVERIEERRMKLLRLLDAIPTARKRRRKV